MSAPIFSPCPPVPAFSLTHTHSLCNCYTHKHSLYLLFSFSRHLIQYMTFLRDNTGKKCIFWGGKVAGIWWCHRDWGIEIESKDDGDDGKKERWKELKQEEILIWWEKVRMKGGRGGSIEIKFYFYGRLPTVKTVTRPHCQMDNIDTSLLSSHRLAINKLLFPQRKLKLAYSW